MHSNVIKIAVPLKWSHKRRGCDMKLSLLLALCLISWHKHLLVTGKDAPTLISIPVKGQKDIVFKEGENPCKVLKKYCKSAEAQLPIESCNSRYHLYVAQNLISQWEKVHKRLRVSEELFIDCQQIDIEDHPAGTLVQGDDFKVSPNNHTGEIEHMLLLLENVSRGDGEALKAFNVRRSAVKFSDRETFELYRRAILILPTNIFFVNEFGIILMHLGHEPKARKLFDNAVRLGLWDNTMQRPVHKYVKGLTAKPWHDKRDYPFIAKLEKGIPDMREELLLNLKERPQVFTEAQENLQVGGKWTEMRIKIPGYDGYTKMASAYFPKTVKHLQECGQEFMNVKFSAVQPGTYIRPHTGPTNERLRIHLTLLHTGGARIRVGHEWRSWEEGKAIIFDDSWEHEVMHTGKDIRVVVICDIWHPELPESQRNVY